jgi:hypothetical protein
VERTTTRSRGPQRGASESAFSLDELQEWKTQLETVVREHPIVSAGIAVGAGVLIARLVKDALDDDKDRKRRRHRRGGFFGGEIGRAIMGSIATMAAAKLQEALIEHVQEEAEEEPEPVRRRPGKQGSPRRPPTRRRKVEE